MSPTDRLKSARAYLSGPLLTLRDVTTDGSAHVWSAECGMIMDRGCYTEKYKIVTYCNILDIEDDTKQCVITNNGLAIRVCFGH